MTLQSRAFETGSDLRGVAYHPGGKGRVITLDPPYELPEGMDLRGIAGVVLRRTQNAAAAAEINALPQEELAALRQHVGLYNGKEFTQKESDHPRHPPAPYAPPKNVAQEIVVLADAFQRLTGSKQSKAWFPSAPAPTFHVDGAVVMPQWRLTYAFTGAQTIWHSYVRDKDTPVVNRGGVGFPVIPESRIGTEGKDFFASEGALMFLWNSPNGLFHATPPGQTDRRFVVTLDTPAPRRLDCTRSCPFPCR